MKMHYGTGALPLQSRKGLVMRNGPIVLSLERWIKVQSINLYSTSEVSHQGWLNRMQSNGQLKMMKETCLGCNASKRPRLFGEYYLELFLSTHQPRGFSEGLPEVLQERKTVFLLSGFDSKLCIFQPASFSQLQFSGFYLPSPSWSGQRPF